MDGRSSLFRRLGVQEVHPDRASPLVCDPRPDRTALLYGAVLARQTQTRAQTFFLPIEPTANLTIETRDGAVDTWSVSGLSVRRSWLAGRNGLLDCIETADKIGDQSKDIVRDARAVHVLRDKESAADLRHKRVRIAKLVSAGKRPFIWRHDHSRAMPSRARSFEMDTAPSCREN